MNRKAGKEKIMTMTNAEWTVQNGYKFSDIHVCYELDKTVTFSLNGAIVGKASYDNTCLATFKAWLDQEHKEPILDDAEKRYLSAVIKPFRNDVTEICKRICKPYEYLRINGKFNNGINYFFLPNFDAGTMYKGMKSGHGYTLEELGL